MSARSPGFAVENHLEWGHLPIRDRNVWVYKRFTARLEREPKTGLRLELDVEVDRGGNPHCRAVRLSSDPEAQTFDDSITTARWREVNLHSLTQQAFRAALLPMRHLEGRDDDTFEIDPDFDRSELDSIVPQGVRRSKSRKPLGDDELRRIADIYRSAVQQDRNPTKLLADHFKVNRSTARRWVQRAEQKGFLEERLSPGEGARQPRRRER